jgi:hypothetical protein
MGITESERAVCVRCGRPEGATAQCVLCCAVRLNEAAQKLHDSITAMHRTVERIRGQNG